MCIQFMDQWPDGHNSISVNDTHVALHTMPNNLFWYPPLFLYPVKFHYNDYLKRAAEGSLKNEMRGGDIKG